MIASLRSRWRSLSMSFVDVKGVTHSRITIISCRSRFSTSAAKAEPTVSGGSDEPCSTQTFGVFNRDAH